MKSKTHKASQKRFKLSASGKLMHNSQFDNSHLKANKDRGIKARKKGQHALGATGEVNKILKLMVK
jgi:ribosomal protein L35